MKQIEPLYQSLVKTGKIEDKEALKENLKNLGETFSGLAEVLITESPSKWWISGLRFDFLASAKGTILPAFATIGGDLRFRLEWKRIQAVTPSGIKRRVSNRSVLFSDVQKTNFKDFWAQCHLPSKRPLIVLSWGNLDLTQ